MNDKIYYTYHLSLKMISLLIISVLLVSNVQRVKAQTFQAALSHYSTDNGLASNVISDIKQDGWGYIWIATWNGLSRYDGFNFYNYMTGSRSKVNMLHNRIIDMKIDNNQNVWLRMYDGRVFILNRTADRIENPFAMMPNNDAIITRHSIIKSDRGGIFVLSSNMGIYRVTTNGNTRDIDVVDTKNKEAICMTDAHDGDMWVGTNKGIHLLKADNMSIEREVLFGNEYITCIYSNDYCLYAGTLSGKIIIIPNGQQARVLDAGGRNVASLFVDSHNMLWFSTEKQGISRMNIKTGNIYDYNQKVTVPEYDVYGAKTAEVNGVLWMNMNHGGFGYYNRRNDRVEYFYNNPDYQWSLSNTLASFLALPEGVIWETTSRRGLEKLELLKKTINRVLLFDDEDETNKNEIRAMYYDEKRKNLLIGNKSSDLVIINNGKRHVINSDSKGRPLGRIYDINMDRHGNYWVCSKATGLIKIVPSNEDNGHYQITSFSHDNNDIWSISNNNVYCTVEDKDGNIWAATYDGGVNVMTKNRDGKIVFLNSKNVMKHYPALEYSKVRTMAVDKDGRVWAGTTDGILIMTMHNRQISISRIIDSQDLDKNIRSKDIVCLRCAPDGTMWIGTNGGGMSHFIGYDDDGKMMFESFGMDEGLPSDEIRGITFDYMGNVWFTTDHIICSFDTHKRIFSTFSIQDGVDNTVCSEGSAITLPNGDVMFGTLNGYYLVDRKRLTNTGLMALKLRITDFFLNDELVSPCLNDYYDYYVPDAQSVTLPSHNSVFSFRFASMNYQLQHRVHYQYMLEGHDKEWLNADKSRRVSYSSLKAGRYIFKVKAFLLESPEKYEIKTIEVIVPPLFLLSAAALWIYLLLLAIAIWLLLYLKKKRKINIDNMRTIKLSPEDIAFKEDDDYEFVKKQLEWLEEHYADSNLKIEDMVTQSKLGRTSYYNELKTLTGMSPKEFISDFRMKKGVMFIENTCDTIAEVAYNCGFNDPVYFARLFKNKMGVTPSKYREMKRKPIDNDANKEKDSENKNISSDNEKKE